ncbi:hypothetical protein BHE74_00037555 [Ensete ventricosum]|nr:hypothetical protein BHE74_00037555 [Ensete ventricosum]
MRQEIDRARRRTDVDCLTPAPSSHPTTPVAAKVPRDPLRHPPDPATSGRPRVRFPASARHLPQHLRITSPPIQRP